MPNSTENKGLVFFTPTTLTFYLTGKMKSKCIKLVEYKTAGFKWMKNYLKSAVFTLEAVRTVPDATKIYN